MTNKKQKPVASVSHTGNIVIGSSDIIRWDDVMTVQGVDVKLSKAVTLGLEHKIPLAELLQKDLKSKTGLLITFPIAILMSQLQEKLGNAEELTELVRPDTNMDNVYNPDICPSSLNEYGEPVTEGETAHRWDEDENPVTCAECGASKD